MFYYKSLRTAHSGILAIKWYFIDIVFIMNTADGNYSIFRQDKNSENTSSVQIIQE